MNAVDPHRNAPLLHQGSPIATADAVLICLHGRGASAEDAVSLGHAVAPPNAALVAPQAYGHSWYPRSFLAPIEDNQPHLDSAIALLTRLIDDLRESGVMRERTMIVGFSQGACLACEFAARHPAAVSRAAILTGGLIGQAIDESRYPEADQPVRVHLTTGVPDPHVPEERVVASADVLERNGHIVSTVYYPQRPHAVSRDEIVSVRGLLRGNLGPKP